MHNVPNWSDALKSRKSSSKYELDLFEMLCIKRLTCFSLLKVQLTITNFHHNSRGIFIENSKFLWCELLETRTKEIR